LDGPRGRGISPKRCVFSRKTSVSLAGAYTQSMHTATLVSVKRKCRLSTLVKILINYMLLLHRRMLLSPQFYPGGYCSYSLSLIIHPVTLTRPPTIPAKSHHFEPYSPFMPMSSSTFTFAYFVCFPRFKNSRLSCLRLPTDHKDLSLSSDLTHISSSFSSSPLSPFSTHSPFHSRLKTHLFHKSISP